MSPSVDAVVVTGAADGIGKAIALKFLANGWAVHVCDNREDALRATLAEHPGLTGSVADVGTKGDVDFLFREARTHLGSISALVNNVGIGGPRAAIEDIDARTWSEVFRVNVAGALYCMQAVIPGMKAGGGGSIVNISTASTRTGLPMRTPYVASKLALEGLTRNAARELGPWGIRCNAVLPGIMDNARMASIIAARAGRMGRDPTDVEAQFLSYVSMRSKTRPEDVSDAVLFLASSRSGRVTGEMVAVSGNLEWEE